jgi:hypothetical protein
MFQIVTWVVGPCIVLQVDTSVFGDTDCTHSDPEDGGSMIFRNVGIHHKTAGVNNPEDYTKQSLS